MLRVARRVNRLYNNAATLSRSLSSPRAIENLPSSSDVVIVGGGVAGCSLLYHLSRLGVSATLLEKDEISAGTTFHAAGIVWHLRSSTVHVNLLSETWDLMQRLEREEGESFIQQSNGSLFLIDSQPRMHEYERLSMVGRWTGVENELLTAKEAADLHPYLNTDHFYAALYSPTDGGVDVNGYCRALFKGAVRNGGKAVTGVRVTDIETADDGFGNRQVSGVVTSHGRIATKCVVNCCGIWAPALGAMAGVNVPLIPLRYAYVITDAIEEFRSFPMLRHNALTVYIRPQGDSALIGGYEPNPAFANPEHHQAFSLYEMDWHRFSPVLEGASKLLPVLDTTGIKSTVYGPESFTMDHKPLLGESPEVRGFFLDCGFSSGGIMMSGGCGHQLAKWIVNGRPDLDLFAYDIRRFSNDVTGNPKWVQERSYESFANHYRIQYPHDEPLGGRNVQMDALYDDLLKRGAFYQERHGFERPAWFDPDKPGVAPLPYSLHDMDARMRQLKEDPYLDRLQPELTYGLPTHFWNIIGRECRTCRNKVVIFNQSSFGKCYLAGPDSQAAADWIFSARMDQRIGRTVYTCALNNAGGIEGDLTVSMIEGRGLGLAHSPILQEENGKAFYLTIGGTARQYLMSHIRNELAKKRFRCSLIDRTHDMVILNVQGRLSRSLLQSLTSTNLSDSNFPFSTHQTVEIANESCRAMRITYVGEMGWELHIPRDSAVTVYRALVEEGEKRGVVDAGFRALNSLSLEKGYRRWQGDIGVEDTPIDAGLEFTCKLNTGQDFLGRDAVLKQQSEQSNRRLILFSMDRLGPRSTPIILHGQELIFCNDNLVSYVQRADFGFSVDKSLANGYVDLKDNPQLDGRWEIEVLGRKRYPVTAHKGPIFDPENRRVKGDYH